MSEGRECSQIWEAANVSGLLQLVSQLNRFQWISGGSYLIMHPGKIFLFLPLFLTFWNRRFYYYNTVKSMTVWHRPIDADIIPLARFQQKEEEEKMKARLPSSAGHSMSSREDLIEAIQEETIPPKFSTFQPKSFSGHQHSRSNVIVPIRETNAKLKFKEPLHQRSQVIERGFSYLKLLPQVLRARCVKVHSARDARDSSARGRSWASPNAADTLQESTIGLFYSHISQSFEILLIGK